MRKICNLMIAIVMVFGFSVKASATLVSRAGGMVYDTDLNITWLGDANYARTSGYDADGRMNWSAANTWAINLVYGGFDDWRLPTTLQSDLSCSRQIGSTSYGYNCTGSEMAHLFYSELGGTAGLSILTSGDPDLALFTNLQAYYYWSGTDYANSILAAWLFPFNYGYQNTDYMTHSFYAWAVRPGDVSAVPEPGTMLLLGSGIAGLIGLQRKRDRYIG